MNPEFIAENAASRAELKSLIERLQDSDFDRPVGDAGWTVSTLFCHLAFWDQMVLCYLRQWHGSGFKSVPLDPAMIDAVNQAGLAVFRTVPGRAAAELALRSAEATDSQVQQLDDDVVGQILAAGRERILRRSLHRRGHMEKIKAAV